MNGLSMMATVLNSCKYSVVLWTRFLYLYRITYNPIRALSSRHEAIILKKQQGYTLITSTIHRRTNQIRRAPTPPSLRMHSLASSSRSHLHHPRTRDLPLSWVQSRPDPRWPVDVGHASPPQRARPRADAHLISGAAGHVPKDPRWRLGRAGYALRDCVCVQSLLGGAGSGGCRQRGMLRRGAREKKSLVLWVSENGS